MSNEQTIDIGWRHKISTTNNGTVLDISGLGFGESFMTFEKRYFDHLKNLEYLLMDDNKFTGTIPLWFDKMKNLQYLSIKNSNLKYFQKGIFYNLKNLDELHLSNNNLAYLHSDIFSKLVNLEVLHLDGNKNMRKLPVQIFDNLVKLEELKIDAEVVDIDLYKRLLEILPRVIPDNVHEKFKNFRDLDIYKEIDPSTCNSDKSVITLEEWDPPLFFLKEITPSGDEIIFCFNKDEIPYLESQGWKNPINRKQMTTEEIELAKTMLRTETIVHETVELTRLQQAKKDFIDFIGNSYFNPNVYFDLDADKKMNILQRLMQMGYTVSLPLTFVEEDVTISSIEQILLASQQVRSVYSFKNMLIEFILSESGIPEDDEDI